MAGYSAVVARAIAAQGVRHTFGLMGAGTIELVHHLTTDHDVAYHAVRHESGGVGAADGYARASGDVGVCMITWGPALTNTLTALATARRGASPVVLVAGDSSALPLRQNPFAGGTQQVDAERLLAAIDVPVRRVEPATVARDVAAAFDEARRRGRPVVMALPAEHLGVDVADAEPLAPAEPPAPLAPPPAALAAAAEALAGAERPLILAGRGAAESGAAPALAALADRTGALLATSLRGIGLFDGHPYNLNVAGGFSREVVADLVFAADCVVAFGAGLNMFTTKMGRFFADPSAVTVVQVDDDAAAFERHTRVDVRVPGDARLTAEALLAALPADAAPRTAYRAAADAAGLDPAEHIRTFPDVSRAGALDPREVCRRLDALLPRDRQVVSDGGQFAEYPVESMRFEAPDRLHWMMDFGAVGSGLGAGIGAALARPERATVLFIGDGGFFMTMGDLDLAIRDSVPLLVVCMNDRAYGSELYHMRDLGVPADTAFFATPDLAEVARAMGCAAHRIERLEQLEELGERLWKLDGPLFLDVLLTQDLLPAPFREH